MKKLLSLLICLCVIASTCTVCFAASAVKEINTVGNMFTAGAISVSATGEEVKSLSNPDKLTDGVLSGANDTGQMDKRDTFTRADYCINTDNGQYIKLTFELDKPVDFSGIRIYSRKTDAGTTYVKVNNAEKITLEFYDASGNSVKTAELTGTPAKALSGEDGKSWDVPYVDFTVASGKTNYTVSDAKKIVVNILSTFGNQQHFGSEEIKLTSGAANAEKKTVAELKKLGFTAPSASTSSESSSSNTSNTSNSGSTGTTAISTAGEINTVGNMFTGGAISVSATGEEVKSLSNPDKLTDGVLTGADESGKAANGADTFTRADYCINTETGQYIKITLELDKAVDFSGIRIYSRKTDAGTTYVKINNAEKITLEFYDASGNSVKTAELTGTPAKALSGEDGKSWDVPYVDFTVASGKTNYMVSGAKKIVVNILSTFGNQQHFGSEEIKLTNNAAGAQKKTVAELKKLGFTAPSASASTETKKEEVKTDNTKYVDKTGWTISHDRKSNAAPELAIDGKDTTYWHSGYTVVDGSIAAKEDPPFDLDVKLPAKTVVSGISLLPRQDSNASGIPTEIQYFVEIDGEYKEIGTYKYPAGKARKTEAFSSNIEITGFRLRLLSGVAGYGTVAELDLLPANAEYKTLPYDEFIANEAENALYEIEKDNATAEFVGGGQWGGNVIAHVVDGKETTFFQDGATPRPNYTAVINVDLGAVYEVCALGYYARQNDKDGFWHNYKVFASENGTDYKEIADVQYPEVDQNKLIIELDEKVTARFFRYEISKAYGNLFSCSELYFYEDYEAHVKREAAGKQEFKLVIGKNEITANGTAVELDVAPYIENGTTFIPLRGLLELMGATVEWKDESQSVTVTKDSTTILLQIRNFNVDVTEPKNGTVRYSLLAAPRITNSRTFVPIRFISEHLGYNVDWNGETQTVTISTK